MRAGQLRHSVKLQAPFDTQEPDGQPTIGWTDVASLWADIRFLNGIETVRSDAPVSAAKCSVRIRYRAGVTAGMRIAEGATYFNIQAVLPDSTGKRFLDLACEQGANNG